MNLNNISLVDMILMYLYWAYSHTFLIIPSFLLFHKLFKNPIDVSICVLKKKYPIKAILKNGDSLDFNNESMLMSYRERFDNFIYDNDRDLVRIPIFNNTKDIIFEGGAWNGEITNIFVNNVYHLLPVKNKTVVDIGGNIADSAIYFALQGASRVICIEPFPRNYELALKNIQINKLTSIVHLTLAACSDLGGEINIDPEDHTISSKVEHRNDGIKVRLLSLEDILIQNKIPSNDSLILKMDCEGDEYKIILSANESLLRRFSHIIIEYHDGYKDLKQKLIDSGFSVSIGRPRIFTAEYHVSPEKGKYIIGNIFATRT